jgi:tetratricopeptide (TPR) repeat protein
VIVGLGNSYYDIGYFGKDNGGFARSREFYNKALAKRPDDIEVRTDLGLTYFLQDPPDYDTAISEFEKSLAINPKHEKTLSFAALALKNQKKDPAKYSDVLRTVNPNSPTLREIDTPQATAQ